MTRKPKPEQVGTLTIHEPVSVKVSYETAAWHSTIELAPGVYPVYAEGSFGRRGLYANVQGVYTDNHMPALYGGVRVGSDTGRDMIGRAVTHRVGGGWYAYSEQAAAEVFAKFGSFEPLPGADTSVGLTPRFFPVPAHRYCAA